jgi:hypothetical protein
MADFFKSPPSDEPEEGGGPIKSFLEHLEDFRWLIIKTGAALLVCLIVCLYAVPEIVAVLKWPLSHAALVRVNGERKALICVGTNTLATLDLTGANQIGGLDLGTNWFTVLRKLEPVAGRQQRFAFAESGKKSAAGRAAPVGHGSGLFRSGRAVFFLHGARLLRRHPAGLAGDFLFGRAVHSARAEDPREKICSARRVHRGRAVSRRGVASVISSCWRGP